MRKLIYKIFLIINAIVAAALLISYVSELISPAKFAFPAFFGLAYPYLLLGNVLFVITWALLLRVEAFISIITIAIGFTQLSAYIRISKPVTDKTNTFKVLSYNVRMFNFFENRNGSLSEKKVIEFLKSQNPDIICLQEFFITGYPKVEEALLLDALGGKYYSHTKLIGNGKNRYYGIITLSKYPIVRKGEILHPKSSSLSIFTDVIIQKDTFRIYNNHLQSFRLKRMERSFINEMIKTEDKETLNDVKNITVSLKKGFAKRAIQAQEVKANVDHSPYPVIVVGDFNDTPVSYVYRKMEAGLKDSFINSGYGAGFTYRGNYPQNRIDYILYGNKLFNSCFEIKKIEYSDHYPIMAFFKKHN